MLSDAKSESRFLAFAIIAGLSTIVYGAIALLSWRFDDDQLPLQRPILLVLSLFAFAFAAYLIAVVFAWRVERKTRVFRLLIGSAILFRVILLFSVPIQEIDIYRYLWDGATTTAGVSPFAYSPQQILDASIGQPMPGDLARLVELRDRSPVDAEILERVGFPELSTIYPLTSQAVFAIATWTTPTDSPILVRMLSMKGWFVVFDLMTMFLVIKLLEHCGRPAGQCVLYAWCPLLIKEVAGSGHLDAAAVFFSTLAIYCFVRYLCLQDRGSWYDGHFRSPALIGGVLAVAVGAKLYPLILAPLVCLAIQYRKGTKAAIVSMASLIFFGFILVSPLLIDHGSQTELSVVGESRSGAATFLRRWEINDFLFMMVVENLKPSTPDFPERVAWFTVVPESVRIGITTFASRWFGIAAGDAPSMMARAITGILFSGLAMTLAWRSRRSDSERLCEAAFLTTAWFWLLCPTQNPWYWTWALPFLPFARGRAWIAISGLAFLYYLRFWFEYRYPSPPVFSTRYDGFMFHRFVVTWIEFGPFFVLLFVSFWRRRRGGH